MKIVKQFQDDEYLREHYHHRDTPPEYYWLWGLGQDGEVYYQTHNNGYWVRLDQSLGKLPVRLHTMVKIVKEFGHLAVFV